MQRNRTQWPQTRICVYVMLWEIREYPRSALTYEKQVIHECLQLGLLKIKQTYIRHQALPCEKSR